MPMSLPLNRNIINKPKTKRTQSEPPEESWPTAVLYTIHQFTRDTLVTNNLSLKVRKKEKKKLRLFHSLLLNHTNKRKNLLREFSLLLLNKEDLNSKAMQMSLQLNRNIIKQLKTKRTQLEPIDESKLTVVLFMIHQLSRDMV